MRYDFVCESLACRSSGKRQELRLSMDADLQRQPCAGCGAPMRRVFTPARFKFTFKAGFDPLLDQGFDSRRQRDTWLDRNDIVLREARV